MLAGPELGFSSFLPAQDAAPVIAVALNDAAPGLRAASEFGGEQWGSPRGFQQGQTAKHQVRMPWKVHVC